MTNWPVISKCVGWEERTISYPTMRFIEELSEKMDNAIMDVSRGAIMCMLLLYHRFLKSPETEEQRKILERITELLFEGKKRFCDG